MLSAPMGTGETATLLRSLSDSVQSVQHQKKLREYIHLWVFFCIWLCTIIRRWVSCMWVCFQWRKEKYILYFSKMEFVHSRGCRSVDRREGKPRESITSFYQLHLGPDNRLYAHYFNFNINLTFTSSALFCFCSFMLRSQPLPQS